MKNKIFRSSPHFLQCILISLFNIKMYRKRYGGKYRKYRTEKKQNRYLSFEELKLYQSKRYTEFIDYVVKNSDYYNKKIGQVSGFNQLEKIEELPIISKEDLRKNIDSIIVKTDTKLNKSKTGGTTGKSLEVYNFPRNLQERFAFLDDFRSRFGYELGKRTAWFSGKNLLTQTDIKKKRFWKTDYFYHVRYYSTFHIHQNYLHYYIKDLIKFRPEYFVGFPSTMHSIAKYGLLNNYDFPGNCVKAIFPTAETVTKEMRTNIERFFKTKVYDQYASSEGAPFIFECRNGNLHVEMQSGVFEVLDDNNLPTNLGRLVVTSFTNEGTPLIRYDIGDYIAMESEAKKCNCGNNNPLVKEILGRRDDYVYSPENGKINLGNISNTLKDTKGIIRFQAVQNSLNKIELFVEIDDEVFSDSIEKTFINNWRDRIGSEMELGINYVDNIPVESSGKCRFVKNNIKDLI